MNVLHRLMDETYSKLQRNKFCNQIRNELVKENISNYHTNENKYDKLIYFIRYCSNEDS